jgi:HEAT repeat protein
MDTHKYLTEKLAALQRDELSFEETIALLVQIEDDNFGEAIPVLKRLVLEHVDPVVRASTLRTLIFRFPRPEHVPLILEILQTDNDEDVRSSASSALGYLSKKYSVVSADRVLLSIVKDSKETNMTRESAYCALLSLLDKPTPSPLRDWDAQRDIDWDFIRSLEMR